MKLETIKAGAKQLNDFVRTILTDKKVNKNSLELMWHGPVFHCLAESDRNDHL